MQIDELLQEYTASRTQYSQVLNDTTIKMGFECEMVVPYEFAEYNGYDDEYDEPPEFNDMTWEEVEATDGINIDARTRHRIELAYQEWKHKIQQDEWLRIAPSYVPAYLASHPRHDKNDAFHSWLAARHHQRLPHPDMNDPDTDEQEGMDGFIQSQYGSMDTFMREFAIDWEHEPPERNDNNVHEQIANSLREALGVSAEAGGGNGGGTDWHVVSDESVEGDGTNAEVVSGVYTLKDGLDKLAATFRWMNDNNMETNKTTGLHVSFSIDGKEDEDDYDFLKMMILFDENYTAQLFGRLKQDYAKQMRDVLFRDIQNNDPATLMSSRHIDAVIAALKHMGKSLPSNLGSEKFYSFRHRAYGVVEFRNMGGRGYEDKYDVIRTRIINMGYMMKIGADDSLMQREYLTRVYNMLTGTKFSTPGLKKTATVPFEIPYALSSFSTLIQRSPRMKQLLSTGNVLAMMKTLIQEIDVRDMTPIQIRQLRFYLAKNKIDADLVRDMMMSDSRYNHLANLMRWPIVVPGEHPEEQNPLPFALRGHDYSGQPPPTVARRERSNDFQGDFSTLNRGQYSDTWQNSFRGP